MSEDGLVLFQTREGRGVPTVEINQTAAAVAAAEAVAWLHPMAARSASPCRIPACADPVAAAAAAASCRTVDGSPRVQPHHANVKRLCDADVDADAFVAAAYIDVDPNASDVDGNAALAATAAESAAAAAMLAMAAHAPIGSGARREQRMPYNVGGKSEWSASPPPMTPPLRATAADASDTDALCASAPTTASVGHLWGSTAVPSWPCDDDSASALGYGTTVRHRRRSASTAAGGRTCERGYLQASLDQWSYRPTDLVCKLMAAGVAAAAAADADDGTASFDSFLEPPPPPPPPRRNDDGGCGGGTDVVGAVAVYGNHRARAGVDAIQLIPQWSSISDLESNSDPDLDLDLIPLRPTWIAADLSSHLGIAAAAEAGQRRKMAAAVLLLPLPPPPPPAAAEAPSVRLVAATATAAAGPCPQEAPSGGAAGVAAVPAASRKTRGSFSHVTAAVRLRIRSLARQMAACFPGSTAAAMRG